MKTKVALVTVLFGLTLSTVAFAIWLPQAKNSPSASARESLANATSLMNSETPTMTHETTGESSAEKVKVYENLTVSNKGLTVELREIDLTPESPTVTVCTDVPTPEDWLPEFSATYNGQNVGVWGWGWIGPGDTAYLTKYRCYRVNLTPSSAPKGFSGEFVFSLEHFYTIIPERISGDLIAQAKERLKNEGIDFEVENIPHSVSIIITGKPDFYSQEEALQKVKDALTDRFHGPWTFTIDLGQK